MNKPRRKRIEAIIAKLEELHSEIDAILEEEQEAFDNLPESLQMSEKGAAMEEAIDNIEYAKDYVVDVMESLEEVI